MTKEEYVEKYDGYFRDKWAHPVIGNGWMPLVQQLTEKIIYKIEDIKKYNEARLNNGVITKDRFDKEMELVDNFKICQIKEKFGGLRFYVEGADSEIYHWISFAESMSYRMCEECGTTHNLGRTSGWIRVICVDCADKIGKKDIWISEIEYKTKMAEAILKK